MSSTSKGVAMSRGLGYRSLCVGEGDTIQLASHEAGTHKWALGTRSIATIPKLAASDTVSPSRVRVTILAAMPCVCPG